MCAVCHVLLLCNIPCVSPTDALRRVVLECDALVIVMVPVFYSFLFCFIGAYSKFMVPLCDVIFLVSMYVSVCLPLYPCVLVGAHGG